MSKPYIEDLIPLNIRKQYNIISKTEINSSQKVESSIYDNCCKKCLENHDTSLCNKDWIKLVYPDTLEELVSLYDKRKYEINQSTPLIKSKEELESYKKTIKSPIIIPPYKNDELLMIIKKYKINLYIKKKDYNWDDYVAIICIWCVETGREIILFEELLYDLCEKYKIEIDEDDEWETKAETIKQKLEEEGHEIIIGSKPPPSIGCK